MDGDEYNQKQRRYSERNLFSPSFFGFRQHFQKLLGHTVDMCLMMPGCFLG